MPNRGPDKRPRRKLGVCTPENFWARTTPNGDCLDWTEGTTNGYGAVKWDGRMEKAHRVAFFLRLGFWPRTPILRHLCNNKLCVLHAVEGTFSENAYDKVAAGTHHLARRTHCKNGHEFTGVNTRRTVRQRTCRECDNARGRRKRALARLK